MLVVWGFLICPSAIELVAAFSSVFLGWVIVLVLKMYNSQVGHMYACAIAVPLLTASQV
jgi:hypothetical protein